MSYPNIDAHSVLNDIDYFRKEILALAPIDSPGLNSAENYIKQLQDSRIASVQLKEAGAHGLPLIQPRGGFSRFNKQRELVVELDSAGADFIPLTVDSHTRNNDYATAQILLERSELEEKNLLNGYPIINHGYHLTRKLFNGIDRPISLRHGTPDARLLTEVALASGITEIEGGALTYTLPYSKSYPLVKSLFYWQYVDRICALVSEKDRPIHRESFGALTATLVPPFMTVVVELCELLLAAEQGVTSFSVGFSQIGSIAQDFALDRVLRKATEYYLEKFSFINVNVFLVYYQWMGVFPYNYDIANGLIATSAQLGVMLGADKIVTKTKEEARGIPSVKNNSDAVRLVRYVIDHAMETVLNKDEMIEVEEDRIYQQVKSVMNVIFNLDTSSFRDSISLAVSSGYIDIPFSPHCSNQNRLLTRRGKNNGIYVSNPGSVPIPKNTLKEEKNLLGKTILTTSFKDLMSDINLMQ